MVECTILDEDTTKIQKATSKDEVILFSRPWILHMDGSSTTAMSRVGIILTNLDQIVFEYALRFAFLASNNEAEHEALITGLKLAKDLRAQKLKVFSDSQLIVEQVNGEFDARSPSMVRYLKKVKKIMAQI